MRWDEKIKNRLEKILFYLREQSPIETTTKNNTVYDTIC